MDEGNDLTCPNNSTSVAITSAVLGQGSCLSGQPAVCEANTDIGSDSPDGLFNKKKQKINIDGLATNDIAKPSDQTDALQSKEAASFKFRDSNIEADPVSLWQFIRSQPDYVYNCNHAKRGRALIVNQQEFDMPGGVQVSSRPGSDVDARALGRQLSRLQFDVTTLHNQTCQQLKHVVCKFANLDHSDCDSFACVILSHGEEGVVYGTNGVVKLEELVAPFRECRSLVGKPKLFFIQACRGTRLDNGVEFTDSAGDEEDTDGVSATRTYRIPMEADFLMAYSVVPGYYAWRNSTRGSWFIQALAEALEKHAATRDLLWILTQVNRRVAYDFESNSSQASMSRKKQIPCIVSMLTKDVYFPAKENQ